MNREFQQSLYAGLQATLHNAHFVRKDGQPPFSADMWMPGYQTPEVRSDEPQWKRDKRMLESAMKKPDAEQIRTVAQGHAYSSEYRRRIEKARKMREDGVPDSEIRAMMRS